MNEHNEKQIVTRFAPSPTGLLHLGNYRTALFCYLFSKQKNGKFILRIEDTDKERSKKEYEEDIISSLSWLGIEYDEMYRQSERTDRHKFFLKKLIEENKAYLSEEKDAEGEQRSSVIRFRNPNTSITFKDLIRGEVTIDTTDLGDFVIAKSFDEPLFHLAVVVDDFEMGVTHIIRGEDHLSNTPRHILLQRAIEAPVPNYAHLPMVLSPDRTKLSKRRGAKSVTEYRKLGYLPESIINMLVLIGWNPGTDQELFGVNDLIKIFNLEKVQKGGAIFNQEKLDWINREYIKTLSPDFLFEKARDFIPNRLLQLPGFNESILREVLPVLSERINNFSELSISLENGDADYFFKAPKNFGELLPGAEKLEPQTISGHLNKIISLLPDESNWSKEKIKESIWEYATEWGRGAVLWPLRISLSGLSKSPDPFTIASIIGREETITRIRYAINLITQDVK